MKEYKYRHELKFKISNSAAEVLKQKLSLILKKDKNAYYSDGSYLIKSLYFDDLDSSSYYEKMDGVLYRKKYRIRIYNNNDEFIRLEKKMKHNTYTAKEQMLISKDIYSKILNGKIDEIENATGLLEEFITNSKVKHLVPSIIVLYHRTAFTYPISDVRITFDSNIQSGLYSYDLFNKDVPMYDVSEPGKQVLEVKFNEVLPLHIANLLNDIPSCKEAVSKFAICRSIK
ncbi:MAG: polyphosphate polymerase domain-containing protein [Tenericutes bacterium]|nr:polyphosphate polymerase domain-containing protein [Mycoplasmatota bacterium]